MGVAIEMCVEAIGWTFWKAPEGKAGSVSVPLTLVLSPPYGQEDDGPDGQGQLLTICNTEKGSKRGQCRQAKSPGP